MSFYSVSNPSNFAVQNQAQQSAKQIQFLRNGFQQTVENIVNNINGVTYTADQLVDRYLVREGLDGSVTDFLPTAAEIVAALNNNQWIKRDNQLQQDTPVRNGFYFDF